MLTPSTMKKERINFVIDLLKRAIGNDISNQEADELTRSAIDILKNEKDHVDPVLGVPVKCPICEGKKINMDALREWKIEPPTCPACRGFGFTISNS